MRGIPGLWPPYRMALMMGAGCATMVAATLVAWKKKR